MSAKCVRLFAALPPGGAARLEPGRDLLLPDEPAAAAAPAGTLLNDWLDADSRQFAEAQAERALVAWHERVDAALTRDGIPLARIYDGHLRADAFLPVARMAAGLSAFVGSERPTGADLHGTDPEMGRALVAALDRLGVPATVAVTGPAPLYPIGLASSVPRSRITAVREAVGIPGRVRGSALIQPFRNLRGLWSALPARGVEPVLDLALVPPGVPARELAAHAWRGGFIGHPGAGARRRSRAALRQAIATARDLSGPEADPLADLGERRALEIVRQVAADTLAQAAAFRAAVGGGVRTAVVPSDTAPYGRTFSYATRELGGSLVRVQHGFWSDLWRVDGKLMSDVDGVEAGYVAVWAPRDEERLTGVARGQIAVTGNPGAVASPRSSAGSGSGALLLLQPPSASSLGFDVRASRTYLEEALAGLAAAGFSGPVVLRPHPLDPTAHAKVDSRGLTTSVEPGGSLADLLDRSRLCIGTVSTATLEAAAAGVPTIFLDVTGLRLPWPFDDSGDLPRATDRESLAEAVAGAHPASEETRAAAREALGARPDALERVVDLVVVATR